MFYLLILNFCCYNCKKKYCIKFGNFLFGNKDIIFVIEFINN